MRENSGFWVLFGRCLSVCTCSLLAACGSSDGDGADSALFSQAPHCPGTAALKIEGTIAGGAIDDSRTGNDINAGYENAAGGKFYTPVFAGLVPLAENQLALTFEWPKSLLFGESSAISTGNLTLPANHPQAGAEFCVSSGQVGFVNGGSEDGVLKFAITEVKAGADCSGAPTAVDLRGCQQ
jgi:hypothetical protein